MKKLLIPLAVVLLLFTASSAAHASPLSLFDGNWSGTASGRKADGKPESLTCRSYNRLRDGTLTISLRCASASVKFAARVDMRESGGRLSGTWSVVDPSYSGKLSGTASPGVLAAKLLESAFTGSVTARRNGARMLVTVSTDTGLSLSASLGR